jgi:Fe(3+) dicitrate transport protein
MFLADPNQNPVPHDLMKVRRLSASAFYNATLSPSAIWTTSAFAYNTRRNWRRQNYDRADLGRPYLSMAGDLSIPGGAVYLLDSSNSKNREYDVLGVQTGAGWQHQLGGLRNKLDVGLRYMQEGADDKDIAGERFNSPTGALTIDERRTGRAFSAFVQNRFFLTQKLVFTPGVRLEKFEARRHIFRQPMDNPDRAAAGGRRYREPARYYRSHPGRGALLRRA